MKHETYLFDNWNKEKKHIHQYGSTGIIKDFYINKREIWYVKLGINIGYEQNGKTDFKRAVLVLKKIGNVFLVIPIEKIGEISREELKIIKKNLSVYYFSDL